jgi:hypothetical protein
MNTNTLIAPAKAAHPLRIFTLYADFAAGVRAKRLTARITRAVTPQRQSIVNMWTLNSVGPIGVIGEMIAQEAGESDLLVIASSIVDRPDPTITGWLESLVNWKLNRIVPGLLIGLLGDGESLVADQSWLRVELSRFAEKTQMFLGWHFAGGDIDDTYRLLAPQVDKVLADKCA